MKIDKGRLRADREALIGTNSLLRGETMTMSLEDALAHRQGFGEIARMQAGGEPAGNHLAVNWASLSKTGIKEIHEQFGAAGLFRLNVMAALNFEQDFAWFLRHVMDALNPYWIMSTADSFPGTWDNPVLPPGPEVDRFNWNVFMPSLARKLYHTGCRHGYLVYGIGRPRILVSHPFRGRNVEAYDVYRNSLDVVTSLGIRGYSGSFLFLDYLPGLDFEVNGVPAWLVWFSFIATQSDTVLFIRETTGFKQAQLSEIAFTPDRVRKRIVDMAENELMWAATAEQGKIDLYGGHEGPISREEFYAHEASFAAPWLRHYAADGIPHDRLIQMDESGEMHQFPLDFPLY
jgi:hypothetical protein